jgi:hypothetical protein
MHIIYSIRHCTSRNDEETARVTALWLKITGGCASVISQVNHLTVVDSRWLSHNFAWPPLAWTTLSCSHRWYLILWVSRCWFHLVYDMGNQWSAWSFIKGLPCLCFPFVLLMLSWPLHFNFLSFHPLKWDDGDSDPKTWDIVCLRLTHSSVELYLHMWSCVLLSALMNTYTPSDVVCLQFVDTAGVILGSMDFTLILAFKFVSGRCNHVCWMSCDPYCVAFCCIALLV